MDKVHLSSEEWLDVCQTKSAINQNSKHASLPLAGVVHELCHRMKPGPLPVFSSDGLRRYFYALTAHFGQWGCVAGSGKRVCAGKSRQTWSMGR
jgi:hypothetical protein